jgi:spore maturation protein CgeB
MKVLLVGPVAGGSLPVAGAMASALVGLGYDTVFLDFSLLAGECLLALRSRDQNHRAAFIGLLKSTLMDELERRQPDLVVGIAQAPLSDRAILSELRKSGVILTYWFVENFRVQTYWRDIAPLFDIFFSIQKKDFPEALAEIGAHNHYYLPVAYNNNIEEPPQIPAARMEVSFMGAPYPNRVRWFQKLAARIPIKIYGEGWIHHPVPGVVLGKRRITEAEARFIYRNTDVNLNIHSSLDPDGIGGDFVNPRTFEIAGLGGFQLIDNRELLPPLYSDEEMIRFSDESELLERIEYYRKHESERHEIAMNARRRTLADHLYEHRVVEMMHAVEKSITPMKMRNKPSGTQKPFLTFAASRFLIRDRVMSELREAIERIRSEDIRAVYLFGSYASGVPTPKSDVDLLIVTEKADREYLQTEFLTVSAPVDFHILNPDAFARQSQSGRGIAGEAVRNGIRLL